MIRLGVILGLFAFPAVADVVVPIHTIRANSLIVESDLKIEDATIQGAISDPLKIAGLEAKRNLYAGRPIRPSDVGSPALIERNQIISLKYLSGGLLISTEGRALDRGGMGDYLRVLNLSSRNTVTGKINRDGAVIVGQ